MSVEARTRARIAHEQAREEENIQEVVAYSYLDGKDKPIDNESEIDDDLIARIFHESRFVSNDDMQQLWGKFASGAIRCPLKYSYDLLELMKKMDYRKVKRLEEIMPFVIGESFIVKNSITEKNLGYWISFEEWGIISNSGGHQLNLKSLSNDEFIYSMVYGSDIAVVKHEDKSKILTLNIWKITSVGSQLYNIGKFDLRPDYFEETTQCIKRLGFDVYVAKVLSILKDGKVQHTNLHKI